MTVKNTKSGKGPETLTREERLKAALKSNMAKRKAQARARAAHEEESKEDE
ncbi:hypothetical protein HCZ30_06180 [Marivivens donghaensis]|uniref:DUF4169 domain-containing protein n=1 Tax=Marivivens donghaensis TaxID=1699413 RepID=A0ABX0VVC3_9RHOB|nr:MULTISPECIES: hypothetical protein [Marivivens]NIY72023.1 hypothetical protein [Marivivens donghaensis]